MSVSMATGETIGGGAGGPRGITSGVMVVTGKEEEDTSGWSSRLETCEVVVVMSVSSSRSTKGEKMGQE